MRRDAAIVRRDDEPDAYPRPAAADPAVGFVCTPYRASAAQTWFEKLEQLTLNADFMPSVIFAYETSASLFCLGASIAVRKQTIVSIGGIDDLADYLVEDYEMGRRIVSQGKKGILIQPVVDTMVDLQNAAQWWKHQVYWDQNTWAARPVAFFFTILVRAIPFALLFALLQPVSVIGWAVLVAAIAVRIATAGLIMSRGLGDRSTLSALPWLPVRDIAGLVSWVLAYLRRTTTWRGKEFVLTRDGRLVNQ